ncbi:MAG: hypothetical protein AAF481_13935 [Acidobacteriota bacterium]
MGRVDFLISNPGHHLAMSRPVIERLTRQGHRCRVLSLCEFRGLRSPQGLQDVTLRRLIPFRFRSPSLALPGARRARSAGEGGLSSPAGRSSGRLRQAAWRLLLAGPLRAALRERPDLVVLPNDAAYPYDLIAALLRRRGLPFLLLQEGIRFPLPGTRDVDAYGRGGANAIAAWGPSSGEYFAERGAPPESIHLTGSPRFDNLANRPAAAERGGGPLVLLSNPIDDQGFCDHDEKLDLLEGFARAAEPVLAEGDLSLIVRLHPREDAAAVRRRLSRLRSVEVHSEEPLHDLLGRARAAVVLASTVGLEALLLGCPLGVLEIPGRGFVFDYVSSGAARGLTWSSSTASAPLTEQIERLIAPGDPDEAKVRAYLDRALSHRGTAAEQVVRCIAGLLSATGAEDRKVAQSG